MSNVSDFEIRNGYLERYLGKDETVVIPENVTWVCSSAFKDNQSAKKIVFGDSVSHIMCATSRRLCSISLFLAAESPSCILRKHSCGSV